jgi:hypothetical protein
VCQVDTNRLVVLELDLLQQVAWVADNDSFSIPVRRKRVSRQLTH